VYAAVLISPKRPAGGSEPGVERGLFPLVTQLNSPTVQRYGNSQ